MGTMLKELRYSLYLTTHPFKGFWEIKHENRGRYSQSHSLRAYPACAGEYHSHSHELRARSHRGFILYHADQSWLRVDGVSAFQRDTGDAPVHLRQNGAYDNIYTSRNVYDSVYCAFVLQSDSADVRLCRYFLDRAEAQDGIGKGEAE